MPTSAYFRLLDAPPAAHRWSPTKVVLMSGLSDPETCALNAEQTQLLKSLSGEVTLDWNFPFVPCPERPFRPPPLWLAGWRNYRQFRFAATDRYRRAANPHWRALRDSTAKLLVVAQSCGLEILNQLADPGDAGVRVVALGPVARRRPSVEHVLVQGEADWISRRYFRAADVTIPGVGHMQYLSHERVVAVIRERLWTNTSS